MKASCDNMSSKHTENKIVKGRASKDRDVTHEEMQSLLAKLKELVPNMPKNKRLSKLEIIQYVIDYILDLQIALETHPASRTVSSSPITTAGINRQPLGVLPPTTNTCAAQEVNQVEKTPNHHHHCLSDITRPVSC